MVVSRAAAIGYGPAASVTPAACAVAVVCEAVAFELSNWTARCAPFRALKACSNGACTTVSRPRESTEDVTAANVVRAMTRDWTRRRPTPERTTLPKALTGSPPAAGGPWHGIRPQRGAGASAACAESSGGSRRTGQPRVGGQAGTAATVDDVPRDRTVHQLDRAARGARGQLH